MNKKLRIILIIFLVSNLIACFKIDIMGYSEPRPYYITTEPMIIKHITVPLGTKLTYEDQSRKLGKQESPLSEKTLISIDFPSGQSMDWAGVQVTSIIKYFNTEMRGFSIDSQFTLPDNKQTRFSELWHHCQTQLGINVRNIDDWSFNLKNITDIQNCGFRYSRSSTDDLEHQHLDIIYQEMQKVGREK